MDGGSIRASEISAKADWADQLVAVAEEVMDIQAVRRLAVSKRALGLDANAELEIRGRLHGPSERAYELVSDRFKALGYVALFRRSPEGEVILAVPGALPTSGGRSWLALGLFLATLLSMLWTGAISEQVPGQAFDLLAGWPFALSLLGILVVHEMGHYLAARRLGIPASLPYFIPLPMSLLGTMGAVMAITAPPKNRRALIALGAAGPLAGLVVAVPLLILGLSMSVVQPIPTGVPLIQEGNSLLYAGLKYLVFGRWLPSGGEDVFLHPVALAGWAGLLVTALNLIPAGQLDGGHVLYSLIGRRARVVTWVIIVALFGLSFLWQIWLVWAVLVYLLGRAHAVPLDDITPLTAGQRLLAVFVLLVAALVFVPLPLVVS